MTSIKFPIPIAIENFLPIFYFCYRLVPIVAKAKLDELCR